MAENWVARMAEMKAGRRVEHWADSSAELMAALKADWRVVHWAAHLAGRSAVHLAANLVAPRAEN